MSVETEIPDRWFRASLRVRYAETDAAGVVHHAAYLVWFEEGRSELSRQIGAPYADLERAGVDLVVTHAAARYRAAARYDDAIVVETRVAEARSRRIVFDYRVLRAADGLELVSGSTEHTAVARATGRPTRIPKPFLAVYQEASEAASATGGSR